MSSWRSWRLPLILGAGCATAGALVAAELLFPATSEPADTLSSRAASTAATVAKQESTTFEVPDLTSFSDVVDRPLFTSTRRPGSSAPATEQTADQGPPPDFTYVLSGVAKSRQQRFVLLRQTRDGHIIRVAEGEDVDGWRMERIGERSVLVRRGDRTFELEMNIKGNPDLRHSDTKRSSNSAARSARSQTSAIGAPSPPPDRATVTPSLSSSERVTSPGRPPAAVNGRPKPPSSGVSPVPPNTRPLPTPPNVPQQNSDTDSSEDE